MRLRRLVRTQIENDVMRMVFPLRTETPQRLTDSGRELLDVLDSDGAEPDLDGQTNEPHPTKNPDGIGGCLTGMLDSATFDALTHTLDGLRKPYSDEHETIAERNADVLGEMYVDTLDQGTLPRPAEKNPT